ncbi:MAG: GNAT family N-acetyltransferase [Muribaculaceae bacterium]|nr:GNAT family N-acetyltransferase [Muribaculaceae bacterium]
MLKLNFHPSKDVIDSFYPVLRKEYEESGHGMYCSWDTIIKRQKKDEIITLHLDNKPISFVTWYRQDKIVELEIIWSLPEFRGLGYGFKFQQLLTKEFKKRGDVALTLFCATNDGLSLSKRCGFTPQLNAADFSREHIELGLTASYIKILRNTEADYFDNEDIVILCFEKYHDDNTFYGEINLSADFETKPVYWFVDEEWYCKVMFKGHIIFESQMKYLLRDLKIKLYNYTVAYIDHNISIPEHWFK